MPNTQAMPTQMKVDVLLGVHNFTASTGDVFKIALYNSTASYNASTSTYSATNEITGTGYTAGGLTLTNVTPVANGTAGVVDFNDAVWTGASFTARGALIYNTSKSNKVVAVLDFGADQTVSSGTFTVQFPVADSANAIIRFN